MNITDTIYTTDDVARILNLSTNRVRQMITKDHLPAYRLGKQWIIKEQDLINLQRRKPGRPCQKKPNQP